MNRVLFAAVCGFVGVGWAVVAVRDAKPTDPALIALMEQSPAPEAWAVGDDAFYVTGQTVVECRVTAAPPHVRPTPPRADVILACPDERARGDAGWYCVPATRGVAFRTRKAALGMLARQLRIEARNLERLAARTQAEADRE